MNFKKYSPILLRDCIEYELQTTDDSKTATIRALKNLKKNPDHYAQFGILEREPMTKARVTKYIKRIPKPSGKGYYYFYTQDQLRQYKEKGIVPGAEKKEDKSSWVDKFANFFGFKNRGEVMKRAEDDYKTQKVAEKYSLTWDDWKKHLAEYFLNKDKWDVLIQKKIESQQEAKKNADKKAAISKEYKDQERIKKTAEKGGFNFKIMYLIYNTYKGVSSNETDTNTGNEVGDRRRDVSTGNKSVQSGRIKPNPLSDVQESKPTDNRTIDVLASSVSGERPGRDVRLKPSQIKENRKAILELLASKTNDEMTEEDKNLLRLYEGAGGLKGESKSDENTLYEYYTPRNVVSKVWDIVKKYSGDGPQNVLEPSAGIGRFAENQPDNFDFTMLELDETSARINQILFPDADVKNQPFQEMFMQGRQSIEKYTGKKFDVVIGNPPYGKYEGFQKGLGEGEKHTRYEEYFIDRGLDALEEGGVMAYVVPSGFLRGNAYSDIKSKIAKKGRLMEAYRLPNGTFQTTGVGTDIIVIRKEQGSVDDFLDDKYFKDNPENILGEQTVRIGRFGPEQYVALKPEDTFDSVIDKIKTENFTVPAIGKPTEKQEIKQKSKISYKKKAQTVKKTKSEDNFETMPDVETDSVESFNAKYNKKYDATELNIWKNTDYSGKINSGKLTDSEKKYIETSDNICIDSDGDYVHIANYASGDIYKKLDQLEEMKGKLGVERYERQKKILEDAAPEFKTTKNFTISPISDFAKTFSFDGDEEVGGKKINIVDRFFKWATGSEHNRYRMNWSDGVTQHDIPSTISWSDIVDYIEQVPVRASKGGDSSNNKFIAAKTKELRRDITEKLFKRFIETGLNPEEQDQLEDKYNRVFNSYNDPDYSKIPIFIDGISTKFKTKELIVKDQQLKGVSRLCNKGNGLLAYDVGVGKTLTGIIATVNQLQTGRAKRPIICVPKAVYRNWMAEIRDLFPDIEINELGNMSNKFVDKNLSIKAGTLSVMTYEGLENLSFKKDTIEGDLATDMIDSQQIDKEMTEKQRAEARQKVMETLGMAVKTKGVIYDEKGRETMVNINIKNKEGFKRSNGDGIDPEKIKDAFDVLGEKVLIVKSAYGWEAIEATSGLYIARENSRSGLLKTVANKLEPMDRKEFSEKIASQPKVKENVEDNFETMPEEKGKSGAFYFEDLGFDHITVDEIHNFKNVFGKAQPSGKTDSGGKSKQTANEFQGLTGSQSNRALKLFAVTQVIQKNNDDRNVFGLSATPFTNSPIEIYNILSHIARKRLKELGIYNLHEFMSQFAKIQSEWAIDSKGEIVQKQVMKSFQNLSALQSLIREYIDKVDGEEAGVIRPVKNTHIAQIGMTTVQKAIYKVEMQRFDQKDVNGRPMPGATLKAINNMRMATVSPSAVKFDELYDESGIPEMVANDDYIEDSPKLKFTTDAIADFYKERQDLGQVMYMPRGVKESGLVVDNLVKKGIPNKAIAVINSNTTEDKKQEIMKQFNDPNGSIKVIIGSETIKEGVNLNGNTAVLYNTLLGWNPSETTQVEGRAWRQGNKQGHVHIVYPQLIDSVDSSMYQKHDEKSQRFNALWSFKGDDLNVEDINAEEIKFDLIKDPEKRAKFTMDIDIEKIDGQQREKRIFIDILNKYKTDYNDYNREIETNSKELTGYEDDVKEAEKDLILTENELKDYKKKTSKKDPDYEREISGLERGVKYAKEKVSSEKKYVRNSKREIELATRAIKGIDEKLNDMGIQFSNIDEKIATENKEIENLHEKEVYIKNNKDEYVAQAKAEIEANKKVVPALSEATREHVATLLGNLNTMDSVLAEETRPENRKFVNSKEEMKKAIIMVRKFNEKTHMFEYRRKK